jgi:hypothetical protein
MLVRLPDVWSELGECPVCGAEKDQPCSIPDPTDERLGIELATQVHAERLE